MYLFTLELRITDPLSQGAKDTDGLPGNKNLIQSFQALMERWKCPKPQDTCLGNHCYIDPEGVHLPLSHERLECWASAILKGETCATLETPPNHKLFDPRHAMSPVLKQRLKANKADAVPAPVATAPIFNFSIGSEVARLFNPGAPIAETAPTAVAVPSTLLPPTRVPGLDLPIVDFCQQHHLDNDILGKLKENRYKNARTLCFVTIADLKEMGFLPGEIGELRDAVEKWSEKIVAA
jgi:hypothetical protein